jgi:polyisoprenoid-binding protein YceI
MFTKPTARRATFAITAVLLGGSSNVAAFAAPAPAKVGGTCTVGQRNVVTKATSGNLRCELTGKKLVWKSVPEVGGTNLGDKDLAAIVGTWRTTSDSEAGYRMREYFVGAIAKSDAVGRTKDITGTVEIGARKGVGYVQSVRISIELSRLTSEKALRDDWLKTAALETDIYKTATFETTAPVAAQLPAEGQVLKTQLPGELTVHGKTKSVTIGIEARRTGDIVDIVGSTRLTLSDFAIETPVIPGVVSTDDTGLMEFALVLKRG